MRGHASLVFDAENGAVGPTVRGSTQMALPASDIQEPAKLAANRLGHSGHPTYSHARETSQPHS